MKISIKLTQSLLFVLGLGFASSAFGQLPNLKNAKKFGKKVKTETNKNKTTEKNTEQSKEEIKSVTMSDCSLNLDKQLKPFDSKLASVKKSQAEGGAPNFIENEIRKLDMLKESMERTIKQCEDEESLNEGVKKHYDESILGLNDAKEIMSGDKQATENTMTGYRKLENLKAYWYQFPTSRIKAVGAFVPELQTKEQIDVYHAAALDEEDTYLRNGKETLLKIEEKINEEKCDKNVKRTFQEWNTLASNNGAQEAKERFETFISDMEYYQTNVLPENPKLKEWSKIAKKHLENL